MKIIDLFIKVANGEEVPTQILYKYKNKDYYKEHLLKWDSKYNAYYYTNEDEEKYPISYLLADNLWNLNDRVEIIEDKPSKIEELTLNGEAISYGSMNEWLDFTPNDNEQKICSSIEAIGINQNKIAKAVNYLLEKSDSNE